MPVGMSREEIRTRLLGSIREGFRGARNVASLSRALGYQMAPPPEPHKLWAATNSIAKELAEEVAEVIAENNRRIEALLEERLGAAGSE